MYVLEFGGVEMPEHLIDYIDYEAYGRDVRINESGHFAPGGYVFDNGSRFIEHYSGREDIPDEHKVFSMPKLNIREQMAAYKEIYGCGVYGIACYKGTGELYVYSSTIRDCACGALNILDGNGRFEFHNCSLTGSSGYDQYEPTPYSELAFYECVFGANETSYYMFREDIYTEDCVWSENYEYPEYGYEDWAVFDPDSMESAAVDEAFLSETFWAGHAMVNPESGETVMIPYQEPDGTYVHVSLELNAGGASYFETASEHSDGTWTCDDNYIIRITLEDGRNYYASAYTMGGEGYA